MSKAIEEIEREIQSLTKEERRTLLRDLIADLDAPMDENVERAWLETCQRRYKELAEGEVEGVPGPDVFERLRSRLGE